MHIVLNVYVWSFCVLTSIDRCLVPTSTLSAEICFNESPWRVTSTGIEVSQHERINAAEFLRNQRENTDFSWSPPVFASFSLLPDGRYIAIYLRAEAPGRNYSLPPLVCARGQVPQQKRQYIRRPHCRRYTFVQEFYFKFSGVYIVYKNAMWSKVHPFVSLLLSATSTAAYGDLERGSNG